MTFDDAEKALDLIERVDNHATDQRVKGLEAIYDASDRQVAQLAQLKSLNMDDAVTGLIATLVADAAGEETDPT